MIRWGLRLVALVLLGIGVLARAVPTPSTSVDPAYEETTITSYDATFDVDQQGDLTAVERLTVSFPNQGKHGIFRFFDVRDPNDSHARRVPHDIVVTRDGAPEPMELLSENGGRYRVAKIGSPDSTLTPGRHVYEIRYRIDGVLLPGASPDTSRFYWNLIPGGWQQAIDRSVLTVTLPADTAEVRCAVGVGATSGCTARGAGTATLTVRTGPLPPRTPVTLRADVAVPTPAAGGSLPWTQRFDPVLGTRLPLALLVAALAALAGAFGYTLSRGTREPRPPFPLQYAPPDGLGPAQGQYVLTERVGRESFVASIMQAAEKGAVTLDRSGSAWSLTDRAGPVGWAGVDRVTSGIAGLLSGPKTSFTASRSDVSAGKILKRELDEFESNTKAWARADGLMVPVGLGSVGGLAVLAGAGLAGYLTIANPLTMTLVALVPGLFAIGAAELLDPGASTRRTAGGRDLWSRLGGFRRVLATPSSVERFGFSGRQELYTAYVPWAVAFGCAKEWAEKYRTEMGAEPPVPPYFVGGYASGSPDVVDQMVGDFSATLSSAISSYEATQRSSSSGGGGFSGGGGGGGGGGGSW